MPHRGTNIYLEFNAEIQDVVDVLKSKFETRYSYDDRFYFKYKGFEFTPCSRNEPKTVFEWFSNYTPSTQKQKDCIDIVQNDLMPELMDKLEVQWYIEIERI